MIVFQPLTPRLSSVYHLLQAISFWKGHFKNGLIISDSKVIKTQVVSVSSHTSSKQQASSDFINCIRNYKWKQAGCLRLAFCTLTEQNMAYDTGEFCTFVALFSQLRLQHFSDRRPSYFALNLLVSSDTKTFNFSSSWKWSTETTLTVILIGRLLHPAVFFVLLWLLILRVPDAAVIQNWNWLQNTVLYAQKAV